MSDTAANYSPLQHERAAYVPPLPSILARPVALHASPAPPIDKALGAWLPHTCAAAAHTLTLGAAAPGAAPTPTAPLRIGVVFCGRQCPGGHNVVAGMFDALRALAPASELLGFVGGTLGLFAKRAVVLTAEAIAPFRNQVRAPSGRRCTFFAQTCFFSPFAR